MCCFDAPLSGPRKPSVKDRANTALWSAKFKARAVKGAAIARAKRLAGGIRARPGGGIIPFGGRASAKPVV